MRQPPGYEVKGFEHLVCELLKSIYGVKQASLIWNELLDSELKEIGFKRLESEPCVYRLYRPESGIEILLSIYVDDGLLTGTPHSEIEKTKQLLKSRFRMKDQGLARYLLGIKINQSPCGRFIELSQRQYIIDVLKRFGFENATSCHTPMDVNFPSLAITHVSAGDADKSKYPYQAAVGCFTYAMIGTCAELALATSVLGQYATTYTEFHWKGASRVFRYLQYRKDFVLCFDGDATPARPLGYSDADWAGDLATRRSTTGYCFLLSGAAICWKSRKQQTVAASTTEAEYMSLGDATKEALWLRSLLIGLGTINDDFPIPILVDNQGAIHLAKNPLISNRSKHIDIRHHFVREKIVSKLISLQFCPTDNMVADIFTKPLDRIKFSRFTHALGIRETTQSSGG